MFEKSCKYLFVFIKILNKIVFHELINFHLIKIIKKFYDFLILLKIFFLIFLIIFFYN